jgi:hypothetical protein
MELITGCHLPLPISRTAVVAELQDRDAIAERGWVQDRIRSIVALLVSHSNEQISDPLAIDFHVPVDAAWTAIGPSRDVLDKHRRSGDRHAVEFEIRDDLILQLVEGGDVERIRRVKIPAPCRVRLLDSLTPPYSCNSPPRRSRRFSVIGCVPVHDVADLRPFGGAKSRRRSGRQPLS